MGLVVSRRRAEYPALGKVSEMDEISSRFKTNALCTISRTEVKRLVMVKDPPSPQFELAPVWIVRSYRKFPIAEENVLVCPVTF